MTFLNATLIFGAIAAAVPIILHLLARREPRRVVFPSIRFLTRRSQINRTRIRVRRWWLLALRIAALVILALALARPAIDRQFSLTWLTVALVGAVGLLLLVLATAAHARAAPGSTATGLLIAGVIALVGSIGWGAYTAFAGPALTIENNPPVSIAIVVDNGPTSAWKTGSDSRIARIREIASWVVTRLPATSRVAVVDRSAQVANFSLDPASALSRIEQLNPIEMVQPIESRIAAAKRLLRTSDLANRQILVITDLARSTWETESSAERPETPNDDQPEIKLTLFDLGEFEGTNQALGRLNIADPTPSRGRPISVSTDVGLSSTTAKDQNITAELQIYETDPTLPVVRDDVVVRPNLLSVDRASTRVSAGKSKGILLTIPSLELGIHHGQVRLIGEDAMPLDNVRYFTVEVRPPSTLLLVSDDDDEARNFELTVATPPDTVGASDPEFVVDRIRYQDLSIVRLDEFDVVALLNPPPTAYSDPAVAEYAAGGGGLFIALGPAMGEESISSSELPSLARRWRAPEPGTFLRVVDPSQPITAQLSDDVPWSDFRIHQYWQLETSELDQVLADLVGTSHPALVYRVARSDRDRRNGRIVMLATPVPGLGTSTRGWNKLFAAESPWPAWLLVRQIAGFLAGRDAAEHSQSVGQTRLIRLEPTVIGDVVDEELGRTRLQLFPPGQAPPVPLDFAEGDQGAKAYDVARAGIYWIRGTGQPSGFSANLADDATKTDRIEVAQLETLLAPQPYDLVNTREEIEFADTETKRSVSLHSPAILLALIVFLLEQVLANRFYSKQSQPAQLVHAVSR